MAPKNRQKSSVPAFDETALARLTDQLDKTLAKSGANSIELGSGSGSGKRKRQDAATAAANSEPRPNKKKRQVQEENGGEPRKAGGRKREREREREREQEQPQQKVQGKAPGKTTARSTLLEEIRALGGDEEDLELIAGVDSDAEDGAKKNPRAEEKPVDSAFKNELAKFASSLGFQNLPKGHEIEEDEEEEGPQEGEEGGGEEEMADDDELEEEEEEEEEEDEDEAAEQEEKEVNTKNDLSRDIARKGKNKGLVFEPRTDWYSLSTERLKTTIPEDIRPYSAALASLKTHARKLLDDDAAVYGANQASTSTQKFMSTIMTSGTLSDKVSALTLAVQESPVHNIKAFETLIGLSGKKSRGQAIAALGALVDLLGNGMVLPKDRRLRPFHSQPGLLGSLHRASMTRWSAGQRLPGKVTEAHLIMWEYEDWLKDAYFRIIQLLEVWCADEIEYSRSRALDFIFGLLRDKPEQEANLLRLLVNKLGDRDRKIASRASYLLLQLLNIHPGMKAIVIRTVELEVLLRPGQTLRTKYYAINTLNQTILSSKDPSIADTLVRIYFDMFVSLLRDGSLGALESVDMADGPGAGGKDAKNKNKKRKGDAALSVNDQDSAQKLVSAVLTGVNRAIPFTATDDSTLEKHLDTLFRITHSSNFNTSVQALMLIQQLAVSKHLTVERFYRTLYESLLDPRLLTSSKQAMYLNLLFRSLKNDVDVRRVKAFVKRMLQVIGLHQPPFACGVLFLVAELEKTFPDLKTLLNVPEENGDDGEEVYRDVPEDDEPAGEQAILPGGGLTQQRLSAYDGRKRDPEYSNADKSCLWELIPFFNHYHPSVTVFASNILVRQEEALPKPELANHTLMHFLDKFVYRNPKSADGKAAAAKQRGGSIMQPTSGGITSASHVVVPGAAGQVAINSAAFWNLRPDQVAAEDVFFHKYYAQVGKPAQAEKASKRKARKEAEAGEGGGGGDGEEEEDAEAEEEEIWEALVNSRPEMQGDGDGEGGFDDEDIDEDDDPDLDLDGYDDSEDEEDGGVDVEMGSDAEGGGSDGFEGIFDDESEEDEEDEEEAEEVAGPKAKGKKGRMSRKEMKSLPTFASVDDYAELLAAEEEGLDDQ